MCNKQVWQAEDIQLQNVSNNHKQLWLIFCRWSYILTYIALPQTLCITDVIFWNDLVMFPVLLAVESWQHICLWLPAFVSALLCLDSSVIDVQIHTVWHRQAIPIRPPPNDHFCSIHGRHHQTDRQYKHRNESRLLMLYITEQRSLITIGRRKSVLYVTVTDTVLRMCPAASRIRKLAAWILDFLWSSTHLECLLYQVHL